MSTAKLRSRLWSLIYYFDLYGKDLLYLNTKTWEVTSPGKKRWLYELTSDTFQGVMSSHYYKEQKPGTIFRSVVRVFVSTLTATHILRRALLMSFANRHAQGNKSQEKKRTDVLLWPATAGLLSQPQFNHANWQSSENRMLFSKAILHLSHSFSKAYQWNQRFR